MELLIFAGWTVFCIALVFYLKSRKALGNAFSSESGFLMSGDDGGSADGGDCGGDGGGGCD